MPNDFWNYEYIPELANTAIPRQLQEASYSEWTKNPSKENMNKLIRTFGKLVNSEIGRYQGTLDRNLLYNFSKKFVADAVRSYNPKTKNQLSTHIVNQLQRLHRLNYRNVQGLRAPEDVQSKLVDYQQAGDFLRSTSGIEPTDNEIAIQMGVSPNQLHNMKKFMKYEQGAGDMNIGTMFTETSKEEEALDLVYHDLPDYQKKILEFKTGYNGSPILSGKAIAKKLNISPVRVTQISNSIGKKLTDLMYDKNI